MGDESIATSRMLNLFGECADPFGWPEAEHGVGGGIDIPKDRALVVLHNGDQCLLGDQALLCLQRCRSGYVDKRQGGDKTKRAHSYLTRGVAEQDGRRENLTLYCWARKEFDCVRPVAE